MNIKQKTIIKPDKHFTDVFCETLFHTKKVKLTGIGIFSLFKTKEMVIDKTKLLGDRFVVPPHYRIKFQPSKTIKAKLKAFEQKQK
jgi:nucleoid DNA-binding protein